MRVRIRAKFSPAPAVIGTPRPEYPLRGTSFLVSIGAHALGIAALLLGSIPGNAPRRPVYEELIRPKEHQVLYYRLRARPRRIAPAQRIGKAPDPRGAEISRQAVIAAAKKPKSAELFILVPAPKVEIRHDMPAPLLVAKLLTRLPSAPPPPEPPKPRKFVPPPPSKEPPKLPTEVQVLDAPAPPSAGPGAPQAVPSLTFAAAPGPPRIAPEDTQARQGNARADIAVASLHPSKDADAVVPNGERPGQFSKAPLRGAASSGEADTADLTVPGLSIHQPKPPPPEPPPAPSATHEVLYAERVRSMPAATLSVPLRPSNRMVPPEVNARFPGRSVYAIVIPMEHMASYSGDWIMWFADRESKRGETPVVRAPVPFRKLEAVDPPAGARSGARIQLAATLGRNGRLDGVALLTRSSPAVERAVLQDLSSWEFHPATRDGEQVEVDVVLEIPFSLPTAIARSSP